jgi:hypothetical protein
MRSDATAVADTSGISRTRSNEKNFRPDEVTQRAASPSKCSTNQSRADAIAASFRADSSCAAPSAERHPIFAVFGARSGIEGDVARGLPSARSRRSSASMRWNSATSPPPNIVAPADAGRLPRAARRRCRRSYGSRTPAPRCRRRRAPSRRRGSSTPSNRQSPCARITSGCGPPLAGRRSRKASDKNSTSRRSSRRSSPSCRSSRGCVVSVWLAIDFFAI